MTDQEHVTLGEIARAVSRIEDRQKDIAEKVEEMISPLAVLRAEMNDLKPTVEKLGTKVDQLWWHAAMVAGGVSVAAFLINHFWK